MKFLRYCILCLSLARVAPCHGAAGTDGASFLDIPVGARPAALGSAYSALASDAYAPVWNPAGLGFVGRIEAAGQHLSYLESIHYEYLGLALPIGKLGSLGASAQYLGSGDINSTDNFGNAIGDFSSHYAAYSAAYGRKIGDATSLGLTAKWIDARIGDFSAHSQAVDIGAMVRPGPRWSFGAVVTNIGSKLTFINEGDSLPLAGHLSAAFHPNLQWTLATEVVQEANGFTSGRAGVEWRPVELLALRTGYKSDTTKELSALAGLTVGMGFSLWGQEFSYAWLPLGDLGTGHYFSFVARFGADHTDPKNLALERPWTIHRVGQTYPYSYENDIEEVLRLIEAPAAEDVANRPTTEDHP